MHREAKISEAVGKISEQSNEHAYTVGAAAGHSFHNKLPLSGPRHPSVKPLAPLELLQNQRRGSITDPSLFSSPFGSSSTNFGSKTLPALRHTDSPLGTSAPSTSQNSANCMAAVLPRPASPYKFGDASTRQDSGPNDRDKDGMNRSPSTEPPEEHTAGSKARNSESGQAHQSRDRHHIAGESTLGCLSICHALSVA